MGGDSRHRCASGQAASIGGRHRESSRSWRRLSGRWSAASGAMVGIDSHPGKRHRSAVGIGNRRGLAAIVRATDGRSTIHRNQGGEIRPGSTIAVSIDARQGRQAARSWRHRSRSASAIVTAWRRWSAASGAMVGIDAHPGKRHRRSSRPGGNRPGNGRTIGNPSQPGRRDSSGIDDRGRHRCAAIVQAIGGKRRDGRR